MVIKDILLFLLYHLLHHVYFVYLAALDSFNGITQILHDSHVIQLIGILEEFQKRNDLFLRSLGHLLFTFHGMPRFLIFVLRFSYLYPFIKDMVFVQNKGKYQQTQEKITWICPSLGRILLWICFLALKTLMHQYGYRQTYPHKNYIQQDFLIGQVHFSECLKMKEVIDVQYCIA